MADQHTDAHFFAPSTRPRVLVLGGTAEGRAVVPELTARGFDVVSSLAGRVKDPKLPEGTVRVGGFGGVNGLVQFMKREQVAHVVDATHPYAITMSQHAAAACADAGVPLVRLARPSWRGRTDLHVDTWHWVDSYEDACTVGARLGRHPFVTTGRQTLEQFMPWRRLRVLARVVADLDFEPPAAWTIIRDRGPYTVAGERALMHEHGVDVLVTKDSGGDYTSAKLETAHLLGVAVVVVRRPAEVSGVAAVSTVVEAAEQVAAAH